MDVMNFRRRPVGQAAFYACFIAVSIAIVLPQMAFSSPSMQEQLAHDCQDSDTAQSGYTDHKRIMVSTHAAFRPLCIPSYKDTLILEGEDTKAYISLVGYHHNKVYFEPDKVTASNAQPNREYDNYRKRSDGQKRRYINAIIPNNDVFSRMTVYLLPKKLFNDAYFFRYFCTNNCKRGTQRNSTRWGGSSANQFQQKRTFQAFMNDAFPAIEKASLPFNTEFAYIVSSSGSHFDFSTSKLEISLSFNAGGVYKPKNHAKFLKPTGVYNDDALYDKNNTSPATSEVKKLVGSTSTYFLEVNEALAEKIYQNNGMRCLAKIKILDWIFADNIDSTSNRKMFMPVWESANDQIDCYANNQFKEHYFSFNWQTGKRI